MNCERCGAGMLDERVSVSGGMVIAKNLSAWHCRQCGRVEYRSFIQNEDMNEKYLEPSARW